MSTPERGKVITSRGERIELKYAFSAHALSVSLISVLLFTIKEATPPRDVRLDEAVIPSTDVEDI